MAVVAVLMALYGGGRRKTTHRTPQDLSRLSTLSTNFFSTQGPDHAENLTPEEIEALEKQRDQNDLACMQFADGYDYWGSEPEIITALTGIKDPLKRARSLIIESKIFDVH